MSKRVITRGFFGGGGGGGGVEGETGRGLAVEWGRECFFNVG